MNKNKAVGGLIARSNSDWEAEDDLRTLVRAAEIRNDKQRLARAVALAKEKMTEHARIAGEGE